MLPLSLLPLLSLLGCALSTDNLGSGSAAAPSTPPRNLQVSSVTATAALVSWEPPLTPNGDIVSYNISYQPSDGRLAVAGELARHVVCVLLFIHSHIHNTYIPLVPSFLSRLCVCCSLNVEEVEVDGDVESHLLTNLRPFTEYNVSVLASTGEGPGPANTTQFTTNETG